MRRPDWVPEPAWRRLRAALSGQPRHAEAALEDLDALVATWDSDARERLLNRYLEHVERGAPLPAAFILSVSDLLDSDV